MPAVGNGDPRVSGSRWQRGPAAALVGLILGAPGIPALAQAPGGYAGIGIGRSSIDLDGSAIEQNLLDFAAAEGVTAVSSSSSEDDSDTALKAFLGYRFNRYVAIEGALIDLGDFQARASATDTFGDTLAVNTDIDFFAFSVAGVGHLPLGRTVSLYGKVGLYAWDVDLTERARLTGFGVVRTGRETEDGTDLFYGAGIEWDLGPPFALRAEWERYNDAGEGSIAGETDLDVIGVSAVFRWAPGRW